jgi:hypothetical protein
LGQATRLHRATLNDDALTSSVMVIFWMSSIDERGVARILAHEYRACAFFLLLEIVMM